VFKDQYADNEAEADAWYTDPDNNRRTPDLLPRDEVARAINSEVKAGRGSPHGGVYLDISSRMSSDEIRRRLPSMYHQFRELADVDITAGPMEVGPTCHYVMGGIEVDADSGAASGVDGLFAAGEVSGGMHGSNRLGGNSLSDLLVFGRRAGLGAATYVESLDAAARTGTEISEQVVEGAAERALAPFEGTGDNPYTVQHDLQQLMNDLVGIIRKDEDMREAIRRLEEIKSRVASVSVDGHRQYNPGWHLSLDLRNMLLVAECVARAGLERTESRGGHTREDYPEMLAEWRKQLLGCTAELDTTAQGAPANVPLYSVRIAHQDQVPMREDLLELFEYSELQKYFTPAELSDYGASGGETDAEKG
jgi:succinate dehydrogenase / fumarate reductase flavoprotein subunit